VKLAKKTKRAWWRSRPMRAAATASALSLPLSVVAVSSTVGVAQAWLPCASTQTPSTVQHNIYGKEGSNQNGFAEFKRINGIISYFDYCVPYTGTPVIVSGNEVCNETNTSMPDSQFEVMRDYFNGRYGVFTAEPSFVAAAILPANVTDYAKCNQFGTMLVSFGSITPQETKGNFAHQLVGSTRYTNMSQSQANQFVSNGTEIRKFICHNGNVAAQCAAHMIDRGTSTKGLVNDGQNQQFSATWGFFENANKRSYFSGDFNVQFSRIDALGLYGWGSEVDRGPNGGWGATFNTFPSNLKLDFSFVDTPLSSLVPIKDADIYQGNPSGLDVPSDHNVLVGFLRAAGT
jgi:hypothetical protein